MADIEEFKSQLDAHVEAGKTDLETFFSGKADKFFGDLTERFNTFINEFKVKVEGEIKENRDEIAKLRDRCDEKDRRIDLLEKWALEQKKGFLEIGVQDRKRNVMISDLPESEAETPAILQGKICDDFVTNLGIPRAEVNKFVFTARHRLQKSNHPTKPTKVIAVLQDLDHANMVFTAARKNGRKGQHIQKHLPTELQEWKNRCLKIRRDMIDGGLDTKEVRVWDSKGFAKLQVKESGTFTDKLIYKVSLDKADNFPDSGTS